MAGWNMKLKILVFCLAFFVLLSFYALAAPQTIKISGVLLDSNKLPSKGTHKIELQIFDAQNKNVESSIFPVVEVDEKGIFFLEYTPNKLDFNQYSYFIDFYVDGKKLDPRQPLTSVPYALNTGGAGGTLPDAVLKNPTEEQVIKGYPLVINSRSSTSALEVLNSESAANFKTTDPKAISPALVVENNGTGIGIDSLVESGPAGKFQSKTGTAGYFKTIGGDYPTLVVKNEGIGIAGRFEVIDQSSKSNALEVTNNGTGTGIDSLVESGLAGKFQSRKGTAFYSKSGVNGQEAAIFENDSPVFSTITAKNKNSKSLAAEFIGNIKVSGIVEANKFIVASGSKRYYGFSVANVEGIEMNDYNIFIPEINESVKILSPSLATIFGGIGGDDYVSPGDLNKKGRALIPLVLPLGTINQIYLTYTTTNIGQVYIELKSYNPLNGKSTSHGLYSLPVSNTGTPVNLSSFSPVTISSGTAYYLVLSMSGISKFYGGYVEYTGGE